MKNQTRAYDPLISGTVCALLVHYRGQQSDSHTPISFCEKSVDDDPHKCAHPPPIRRAIDDAMCHNKGQHPADISEHFKFGYPNCSKQIRYEAGECTYACRHCIHNRTFWDYDMYTFRLHMMEDAVKKKDDAAFLKKWGGKE